MSLTVLHRDVTPIRAEQIFQRAKDWADVPLVSKAETGIRIAKAQSPRLLTALEQCAEVLDKMSEEQRGRTKRSQSTPWGLRGDPAVVQAFREALRACDEGLYAPEWGYLYAATAEFAGHIV